MYIRTTCKISDKINDKCGHVNFVVSGNVYMCVCIYIYIYMCILHLFHIIRI